MINEKGVMRPAEPSPVRSAEVIEVIHVRALTGRGVAGDVSRVVDQYFDPQGGFLFKKDEWAEEEARLWVKVLERIREAAARVEQAWEGMERGSLAGDDEEEKSGLTSINLIPHPLASAIKGLLEAMDRKVGR